VKRQLILKERIGNDRMLRDPLILIRIEMI